MNKTIYITPIKHLDGVYDLAESIGNNIYKPYIRWEVLKKTLENDKEITQIFTNPNKQNFILGKNILEGSNIQLINTCSTGTNHIDLEYCKEKNIEIWSLKEDFELIKQLPSTAELAWGLMVMLLRNIDSAQKSVKNGNWDYEPFVGRQIEGLTVGIIGYGRLGHFFAKYAEAFGMNVLVCDPFKPCFGYKKVNLDEIAEKSNVITLHVHVTKENESEYPTYEMINQDFVRKCKRKPIIINTSRGDVVDEIDIIQGLLRGDISGYGADVISDEYGNRNISPMIGAFKCEVDNIILTPHIGGMTIEGQTRAYKWAISKFGEKRSNNE